jgi:hypothetical protein
VDLFKTITLLTGAFFLAFGLAAYRHFYNLLGVAAGLALWASLRDPLVRLPGLRDHPGTAALLAMILFCAAGVLLASRFRRLLTFLGGFGTGVILSEMITSFFSGDIPSAISPLLLQPGPMDLLAGLVAGVLFLLFERLFAVLLTSALGGFLCAWVLGGRWTFALCLLLGLVAQPLIFGRFAPPEKGKGERGKGGRTTRLT